MQMPSSQEVEALLLRELREMFPRLKTELFLGDEPGTDYMEIFLNKEQTFIITIDSEGIEVSLEYAFFSFLFEESDPLAYRVMGSGYKNKPEALYTDVLSFIRTRLVNRPLVALHEFAGNRMAAFTLEAPGESEPLYHYVFIKEDGRPRHTAKEDVFVKTADFKG